MKTDEQLNELTLKSPQKTEGPIFALIDFVRNPVFLLSRESPLGFDGKFTVSGQLKTVVSGSVLLEDENDLFAAIVHLHKKKYNFETTSLDFTGKEILELMKWGTGGKSYQRLRNAARNLLAARVTIRNTFADGAIGEGGSSLISDYYIVDREKSVYRQLELIHQNRITLSPLVIEKCRNGQLKAVHPIYFHLSRAQEKRLFALISVRASDLVQWNATVISLRDLMPLQGKTYEKFGQLKAKLEIILSGLKEKTVIRKYEFVKSGTDSYFAIYPNHEFFFSKQNSYNTALRPKLIIDVKTPEGSSDLAQSSDPALFKALIDVGLTPRVAHDLVNDRNNSSEAKKQLEHLEYLISNGKRPREDAAWLVRAVKNKYVLPKELETKEKKEKKATQRTLLKSAESYLSSNEFEKALVAAEECLLLGEHPRAAEIKNKAVKTLHREKNISQSRESLSIEALALLEEQAWETTAKLLKCKLDVVKQKPFAAGIWQETLNELVLEKACVSGMKLES